MGAVPGAACVCAADSRVVARAGVLDQVLLELALLFALCVGVAVTFHRLRLPPIVGFLVAGVVVGPHAVGLVRHETMVRELAEVGIVVLLFAVGLEVPLGQLARWKRIILVGGGLQVLGTILLTVAVALAIGLPLAGAVFLGFLLSLSSTAAASKMLVDHGELSAPHGRIVLGIAVAQDLAVVPMVLVIPLLGLVGAGAGVEGAGGTTWLQSLRNLGMLLLVAAAARLLVGPLLALVCRTRNRELFVLFLATWCLGLAVVTAHLGLSLALGAFLGGILLADSDHHSQAAAEVEPFRDAFASLFFVSIGMLFDWRTIIEAPGTVAACLTAVVVGKALVVMLVVARLGQPFWVGLRAALTLAQVGEFSFVLMQLGAGHGILPPFAERVFLVVAVSSIALTPLAYAIGARLAARARGRGDSRGPVGGSELRDHAVVVGYGPTGRAVAGALRAVGIPFVVSEMNAATVKIEKERGVPIVLGDATRVAVLKSLGIERAQLLVLAINDVAASGRVAQLARQIAPHVHVLARAVYNAEAAGLQRIGAHDVVPQELEASVEMSVRALRRFLIADDEIGRQVRDLRLAVVGGGRRAPGAVAVADLASFVPGLGLAIVRATAGAEVLGRSLAEVAVRRRAGCSVVAVRRGARNLTEITAETVVEAGDTVVLLGPEARLPEAMLLFAGPSTPPAAP